MKIQLKFVYQLFWAGCVGEREGVYSLTLAPTPTPSPSPSRFVDLSRMKKKFKQASITGKSYSSFDQHLAEIFKFLIRVLLMVDPVYQ
jgi:hypothetical protein